MNLTEAVARACEEPTLERALGWIVIWENGRAVEQALEAERTGVSTAAHADIGAKWDTCFDICIREVMKAWRAPGTEWAWMEDLEDDDEIHGPFPSRAAALADARKFFVYRAPECTPEAIEIGTCRWAMPIDHLPGAQKLVEDMVDDARDNDFTFTDDVIFDVSAEQIKALDDLLEKWARGLPRGNVFVFEKVGTETIR
jgi:hypothetical protein